MRPDIEAIEQRVNAATPGPWKLTKIPDCLEEGMCDGWGVDPVVPAFEPMGLMVDAAFIAHSREDIPAMLAYVKKLEAVTEKAKELRRERQSPVVDVTMIVRRERELFAALSALDT